MGTRFHIEGSDVLTHLRLETIDAIRAVFEAAELFILEALVAA